MADDRMCLIRYCGGRLTNPLQDFCKIHQRFEDRDYRDSLKEITMAQDAEFGKQGQLSNTCLLKHCNNFSGTENAFCSICEERIKGILKTKKEQPSRNPHFTQLLKEMQETHDKKSHDYAQDSNVYSNFEYAAKVSGCSVDQIFAALIGVKLARLFELLNFAGNAETKIPNNESIDDTQKDLTVYCAIWTAYRRYKNEQTFTD